MEWKITEEKLFGRVSACKHNKTKELCSIGLYGEIYEHSSILIGVIAKHPTHARKISKLLNIDNFRNIVQGEEAQFKIPLEYLTQVVKILKIKRNKFGMARLLNNKQLMGVKAA